MGDLKGHAIPGSFFLLYGVWWAVNCLRRYFKCRVSGTQYVSTSVYALDCCQGSVSRLPVEPLVKVVLSTAGMLGELLAHLPSPPMGIVQHATMYFCFLVSGVVDIAMHYGIAIPAGTDYISMVIALLVEGLLFVSHIHGRSELDIQVHTLLVYVIFATAFVIALESKFNRSAILSLVRAYLLMLQGTWFWAVGIILYGHDEGINEARDMNSHESVMQSTIYFSWHCAVHFILLVAISSVMYCHARRRGHNFNNNTPRTDTSELGLMNHTEKHYGQDSDDDD